MDTEDDLSVGTLNAHVFVTPTREAPMPNASQRGGRSSLPSRQTPEPLLHPSSSSRSPPPKSPYEAPREDPFNQPMLRFSSWPALGDGNRSKSFTCAPGLQGSLQPQFVPPAFSVPRADSYGVPSHMPRRVNSYSIPQHIPRVRSCDLTSVAGGAQHATLWPEIEQGIWPTSPPVLGRQLNISSQRAPHMEHPHVLRQRSWQEQTSPQRSLQRSLSHSPQQYSQLACTRDDMQVIPNELTPQRPLSPALHSPRLVPAPQHSEAIRSGKSIAIHCEAVHREATPDRRTSGQLLSPRNLNASLHAQAGNICHYPHGFSMLKDPRSAGHQDWHSRRQASNTDQTQTTPAYIPSALQFDQLLALPSPPEQTHQIANRLEKESQHCGDAIECKERIYLDSEAGTPQCVRHRKLSLEQAEYGTSSLSSLPPAGYSRISEHRQDLHNSRDNAASEVVRLDSSRKDSEYFGILDVADFNPVAGVTGHRNRAQFVDIAVPDALQEVTNTVLGAKWQGAGDIADLHQPMRQQRHMSSFVPALPESSQAVEDLTITFYPGPIGVKTDDQARTIQTVDAGGQAEREGVKVGSRITAVGNAKCESFWDKLFQDASAGSKPYTVTLAKARQLVVGDQVQARYQGVWYSAEIIDGPNQVGQYRVHFFIDKACAWLSAADLMVMPTQLDDESSKRNVRIDTFSEKTHFTMPERTVNKVYQSRRQEYSHMTVSELKCEIGRRGLDCLFCFSAEDLIARLLESDEFIEDQS